MRIVLIGANGQLGSDLAPVLSGEELTCLTHADLEITDAARVQAALASYRPDVVINTSAFHRVDDCERNPEQAFAVNVFGVRNLALACRDQAATLVHLSTDYVFDGRKGLPYVETDTPSPINAYGISKLTGECFVRCLLDRYFIIRTTGLYGKAGSSGKGGNFVELMLRLAGEGKPIRVVDDQCLTPTYTVDLALKIGELIATNRYGLYHITSGGQCSWFDFAQEIFRQVGVSPALAPQTTSQSGAFARRPACSVLDHAMLRQSGFAEMRPGPEALAAYLERR
jgi:dTDP-4-dehydrorhamnose reductase